MTPLPLRLVIFDCDGVLIDSEPLSQVLVAAEAAALGWAASASELHALTGLRWSDLQPVFERATGRTLPASWPAELQQRQIRVMQEGGVPTMPGALQTVQATLLLGLAVRVASNSSHEEMAVKFAGNGLASLLAGRIHSARDVARGKPSPDLFLAAAAAEGVPPTACLVVEDSRPGIMAAAAAGMACVAYAPEGLPADLARLATPIETLPALIPLLRHAMLGFAA